ncbi:flagellar motor protein MotB [Actinotalea sp. M2MS4P-6]|uniref:OmpA/MotB family protein n=1 Tax=Actinotalea sp. M2MS4P-6 TaxID=2983762 RepID=UPI0021E4D357|nr:flagellar motor protein MotB [Actinotalea sp. M2MS4P-6]MCV2392779.1 flagellar motor protein MotB [Actinotalea sp. M2MS4P-6]
MSAGHGHGSHGRSRRKHEEHEEPENHERWAVSYADMMTVLVGLFIVLFAMSQIDTIKFEQLRKSLAIGFGQQAPSMMAGGAGVLSGLDTYEISPDFTASVVDAQIQDPPTPDTHLSDEQKNYDLAVTEYDRLAAIADAVAAALAAKDLQDAVTFRISERGLIIGMVADEAFFAPSSAVMTPTALAVVDGAGSVLAGISDPISVEGNANTLPPGSNYATNWELAADRAVKVTRRLVEADGIPGSRIEAVSFGDQRPLADDGGDPLGANRRVDLVVLTTVSDDIRAYLPEIAAERG